MLIVLSLILGFWGLVWSANHLVTGASNLAQYYRIPPLIIGLTIVALGTSAPEIIVAITAALQDKTNLAIGNAIGSNIANIGLVLGITALISPLKLQSSTLKTEYPLLFLIMIITYLLMLDGYFSIIDGSLLLVGLITLLTYLIARAKYSNHQYKVIEQFQIELAQKINLKSSTIHLIVGFIGLPISAQVLVYGAVATAKFFGVSELVIGLTIVAIGTSLPEVAASLVGAIKGQEDIALGNILGSNMFNLLAVLAFPGILNPSLINPSIINRDIPIMIGITLILFFISYHYRKSARLNRFQGGLLLIIYCCYLIGIVINAKAAV